MTSRISKAAKWKKYISGLIHLNTSRLTYKLWSLNNTKAAFRNKQEKQEIKEITLILKERSKKAIAKVTAQLKTTRKRPNRK